MKLLWPLFLIACMIGHGVFPVLAATHSDEQLTEIEKQQAREVAIQFTTRFVETLDLNPLVKDLYRSDFIERFKKERSEDLADRSVDLYFVPGLDYNSRLLTAAGTDDWQRFYIAANNFLFFGFMSGIRNFSVNSKELKPSDLYPSSVINLLDSNSNLANMIKRKGNSRAVSSVEEMQKATAILEQAAAIMRKKLTGKASLNIETRELVRLMNEDELFRPQLEIVKDESFGFPKGTRFVFINTPLLFRLILVKSDGELKILSAEYVVD
jgi:hypothetical protein